MNVPLASSMRFRSAMVSMAFLSTLVACAQQADINPGGNVLKTVIDIPLPGPAVRFDYQSLDAKNGRLYMAHMNADQLVVFDAQKRQVIANLDGFKRVHGVIAVPEIDRVFASATGEHQMVAVDMNTLKIVGSAGPINYPDGLAYSPATRRVFVSDEHGGVDAVVDAKTDKLITSIALGGGAGNTVYDAGSGRILVAVHGVNELVSIDPAAMKIVGRYKLAGVENPHGIALDQANRLAFIAGEENHSLAVFDLKEMKLLTVHRRSAKIRTCSPLTRDWGASTCQRNREQLRYSEENNRDLRQIGVLHMPHAHTVSVDPKSHLVYFPLESVDGHPLLRIMQPTT